jgi:hypothetical protein
VTILGLMFALALQPPAATVIDRIMAVVGTEPIMLSDVAAATEFQLVDVPAGTSNPTAYVLDQLIRRRLILTEVDRFQPPEPDPIEITIRVDELRRRAGSPEAFQRALAVTGMTLDQLRRYIGDDLRIRTYILQRFGPDRSQADLKAAVDAWVSDLRRRTQISVLYQGT